MMFKWANDVLLQANASIMLVNDGEMSVWYYKHNEHLTIINEHFTSISLK